MCVCVCVCFFVKVFDRFFFLSNFKPLSFYVLRDLKFSLTHNFKQPNTIVGQFNTEGELTSAPKLMSLSHLILNIHRDKFYSI